jgi:hypothetical protein
VAYNEYVMDVTELSGMGQFLAQTMYARPERHANREGQNGEPMIHVPRAGTKLLSAYQQLRAASENIEDHLLFQSAVKRFYKRNLTFTEYRKPKDTATELVIELTLGGYLENNTITESTVRRLDDMISREYDTYWEILKPDARLRRDVAEKWVSESLAIKTEQVFNDPSGLLAFASFAYRHFDTRIDVADFVPDTEKVDANDYPIILYIAVHKALLRSNDANIRTALHDMYAPWFRDISDLISFNIRYDRLSSLMTTARIAQTIDRNGAPLRILRETCYDSAAATVSAALADKQEMVSVFSSKIQKEYKELRNHIRKGIIKSVIFLLVTKAIVGILVEIPYDLYTVGTVATVPLVINLLFPPLFIVLSGLTLRTPSLENKHAIIGYLSGLLYQPAAVFPKLRPQRPFAKSRAFNLFFVLVFLAVTYFVAMGLAALGFNLVQGIIFFIFLSTASFLGYRLSLQVKEIEVVPSSEGFLNLLRDTFYAPFVFIGRRISYRFARLNLVGQIFDNIIELPLTTILRLLRQWTAFLRTKQDEINT